MNLRKLTPEEEVVFDSIIEQRNKSERDDDFFIYSIRKGQKGLRLNRDAEKYGIGPIEQIKIIQKLAHDGVIDANWIVARGKRDETRFKFAFNNKKKMWDKFGSSLALFSDDDCKDSIFIQLGFDQIKTINDNCRVKYKCTMRFDDAKQRFYVSCEDGKQYVVKKLKPGMQPFEVLKLALKNPCTVLTRDEIKNMTNEAIKIGKKSIATQVFDDSSVVRKELSVFVRLTNDSIYVDPEAELTLVEILALIKVCF